MTASIGIRRRVLAAGLTIGMAGAPSVTPASPALAATGVADVVTMFSDPDEHVGQEQQRVFHGGDSTIQASILSGGDLLVSVSGGTFEDSYEIWIAPPVGEQLHAGLYEGAQRTPFRDPGRPGIDINGMHRGCNTISGRFDIKELRVSGAQVERVWLTYEQHCEEIVPALFGEIRIGLPSASPTLVTAPHSVRWPDHDPGRTGTTIPLTVVANGSALVIDSVTIEGIGADAFEITDDACSGRTLEAGEQCAMWTRFHPLSPGPKVAAIRLTDGDGMEERIRLDGWSPPGHTAWDMTSEAGDYIGLGGTYAYTSADAMIHAYGNTDTAHAYVVADDGDDFGASFDAPYGESLTEGTTYTDALRYPFNGGGAGLTLGGDHRGCNWSIGEFTITEIELTPWGDLSRFGATFEHHCEGPDAPALTGVVSWRAPRGDMTAPAQVTNLTAVRSGSTVDLGWSNPPDADLAAVIVRTLPGSAQPAHPNGSIPAYAGLATSVQVADPAPFTAAVFSVDHRGNVSLPRIVTVPAITFTDIADSPFRADIEWLAAAGITSGCSATLFCPDGHVTREQMASFLVRALALPATSVDFFTDDDGTPHEADINRLAASGITTGCSATRYCPFAPVTRAQMASFLARALGLPATGSDFFTDDTGSAHEADINRLAASGITNGCGEDRFCPSANVTREQMAAFLHRALT